MNGFHTFPVASRYVRTITGTALIEECCFQAYDLDFYNACVPASAVGSVLVKREIKNKFVY